MASRKSSSGIIASPVPYSLDKIENGELDIAINAAICSSHIVMHQLGGNYVETRVVYFGEKHDEERTFGQRCYREEGQTNHIKSVNRPCCPRISISALEESSLSYHVATTAWEIQTRTTEQLPS